MRPGRSRRFLLYAAFLVGFCVLLAFAGCGANAGSGQLTATVSGINFGAVTIGKSSITTVSFVNGGTGAVAVMGVTVTGESFQLMGTSHFPVSIAGGATYSVQVEFSPSSAGQASGEVTVVSNATAGAAPTVNLTGLGANAATEPVSAGVLSGISCNSSSMVGSGTDSCFVALDAAAGSGGLTVSLASSSNSVAVPTTVMIPAGTTGIGFAAKVAAVATTQPAVLTASQGGISESFAIELNAALRLLSASTARVSFGSVTVNSSATQSLILTSSGTEAVTINATQLNGAGFSLEGLALPVILNPGQVIVLNVQFDPASAGNATGQLTITTNSSSGRAMVVNLAGSGATASGSGGNSGGGGSGTTPAPSALSCGTAALTGSGAVSCNVTLSGSAPTGGVGVALASSSMAVTVPASVTVPSGAVSAGFTATAAAVTTPQTVTLTATANGASQTFALQLSAAGAFLSASQTTVAFGNVSLNALGLQTLTLTSTGTLPVTINSAVLTGTAFTMAGLSVPVTLNPGQSVTVVLQFIPTLEGAATGQVTVTSSATTGGSMVIPLTGNGAIPYQVNLSWDAPASSADAVAGYNVYRSLSGVSAYQLLNAGVNLTTGYTDNTVEDGQAYVYYVTSVDASGVESAPSNAYDVAIP